MLRRLWLLSVPLLLYGPPVPAAAPPRPLPRLDLYGDALPEGALARLGTLRMRFPGASLYDVSPPQFAVAPDGKTIAVLGADRLIYLHEVPSGRLRHRLPSRGWPGCLAFSPDSKEVAVVETGLPAIRFWDVASGKQRGAWPAINQWAFSMAFSPDGKHLGIARYDGRVGLVEVWEVAKGKVAWSWRAPNEPQALAFSPNGRWLASGSRGKVHLLDVETKKLHRSFSIPRDQHGLRPTFAPNGLHLAARNTISGTIYFWDLKTGKELYHRAAPHLRGTNLAFSPDGKRLAYTSYDWESKQGLAHICDAATGKEVRKIAGFEGDVHFLPDGRTLACVWDDVRFVDVVAARELHPRPRHGAAITSLSIAPDGRTVAVASGEYTFRFWDLRTGRQIRQVIDTDFFVHHVVFLPDGKEIIAAGGFLPARVRAADTGRALRTVGMKDRFRSLEALALAPDGRLLATSGNGGIALWDTKTGKLARPLGSLGREEEASALAFSPDGRSLVAAAGALLTWDIGKNRGPSARPLPPHDPWWPWWDGRKRMFPGVLAFSPSGDPLYAALDPVTLRALSPRTGRDALLYHPLEFGLDKVVEWLFPDLSRLLKGSGRLWARLGIIWSYTAAALSPDGRMLAVAAPSGSIFVHETWTGRPREVLVGHQDHVRALAFTPDSRALVSGCDDSTLLVWDLTGFRTGRRLPSKLSAHELERLWEQLEGETWPAFQACQALSAVPAQSVPFLRRRVPPVTLPDAHLKRLVTELGDDQFAVRERAAKQLRVLGSKAAPVLRQALKAKIDLETRRRVERLLERLRHRGAAPEELRELRALEVLERCATPEARRALRALAEGTPEARLTEEARLALRRLEAQAR